MSGDAARARETPTGDGTAMPLSVHALLTTGQPAGMRMDSGPLSGPGMTPGQAYTGIDEITIGRGWGRPTGVRADRGDVFKRTLHVFSIRANVFSFRGNVFSFRADVFTFQGDVFTAALRGVRHDQTGGWTARCVARRSEVNAWLWATRPRRSPVESPALER